jgi:hypothetical protein
MHLACIAKDFLEHDNFEEPHQGLGNVPLPKVASK